jgi:hypothetical protein
MQHILLTPYPSSWCNQVIYTLNLCLHNNTHSLINGAAFTLVSLGHYTVRPATMSTIQAFHKVHCVEFGKFNYFVLIMVISIILILFNTVLHSGKIKKPNMMIREDVERRSFCFSQKLMHTQSTVFPSP